MELRYQRRRQSLNPFAPLSLKPFVEVSLSYKRRSVKVWALLDSGADVSIFHASLGTLLGINIEQGLKQSFRGISGQVDGYFHEVTLGLVGEMNTIPVAVAFGELEGVSAILGQADFFQHHQITFERYNERIEIKLAGK